MEKLELTWDEFDFDCKKMMEALRQAEKFDYIIGIGRGGLIPAVMCSHKFGIPLFPITWQTRDNKVQSVEILKTIVEDAKDWDRVLIVDDINDSGKTVDEVTKEIRERLQLMNKPVIVNVATVYQKQGTIMSSDFIGKYLTEDSPWLCFPWED
jgi:hypoxanthine phosphoribosyltransferase